MRCSCETSHCCPSDRYLLNSEDRWTKSRSGCGVSETLTARGVYSLLTSSSLLRRCPGCIMAFQVKLCPPETYSDLMKTQDRSKDNVQSLLALLRSTQDDTPNSEPPAISRPAQPSVPSKRQLEDLLVSLSSSAPSRTQLSRNDSESSASARSRHHLIEPFGPVGQLAGPSRLPFDPQARPAPIAPHTESFNHIESSKGGIPPKSGRSLSHRDNPDFDTLSFSRSLPILTHLLSDPIFTAELRKVSFLT